MLFFPGMNLADIAIGWSSAATKTWCFTSHNWCDIVSYCFKFTTTTDTWMSVSLSSLERLTEPEGPLSYLGCWCGGQLPSMTTHLLLSVSGDELPLSSDTSVNRRRQGLLLPSCLLSFTIGHFSDIYDSWKPEPSVCPLYMTNVPWTATVGDTLSWPCGTKHSSNAVWPRSRYYTLAGGEGIDKKHCYLLASDRGVCLVESLYTHVNQNS